MSNTYLTLMPILFPIFTGFALFSRPIFEDRHIYVGVMTFITAATTIAAACITPEELIVLWRVTPTLSIAFRFDYPARAFACLVSFVWPLVTLYAFEYLRRRPPVDRFYCFFLSTSMCGKPADPLSVLRVDDVHDSTPRNALPTARSYQGYNRVPSVFGSWCSTCARRILLLSDLWCVDGVHARRSSRHGAHNRRPQ